MSNNRPERYTNLIHARVPQDGARTVTDYRFFYDDPRRYGLTVDPSGVGVPTPAEVAAGITPSNYAFPPGHILRYGTNTTPGTTDMASALQAACNVTQNVYIPAGTYKIGSLITVFDGQIISGDSRGLTILISPAATALFFWHPAGPTERIGPSFSDLNINSDFPVTINQFSTFIADGSGDSYCKRTVVKRCNMTAITTNGAGTIGIAVSKGFDCAFSDNEITNYESGMILQGCDICEINNNRIVAFSKWGILEQSAQTFGSQNRIHHNDILAAAGTTATYIKSTSREVAIYDNYLEKPSGTCTGFVDVTSTGAPTYGSNVITLPQSIDIERNRVDGESFGSFVYRLDPTNALTIVCENRKTVGTTGSSAFSAVITAMANPSQGARRCIRISGESWGIWDGYQTRGPVTGSPKGFYITGENINAIVNYDQSSNIVIRGNRFVLLAAFTGTAHFVPGSDDPTNNYLFNAAGTYTATIILRTTNPAGDTIGIGMGSTSHTDASNSVGLNEQWKRFSWAFSGKSTSGHDFMGPYLTRATNTGDIEILSISFELLEGWLPNVPSSNPGAGTKQIWYDTTDSNRVKFAP